MNRQDIEAFVDVTPPYGTQTYGETVRMALINRLMGALPGYVIENRAASLQTGVAWCKFFFPDYQPGPLHDAIGSLTGLDDAFWGGFSTALLCASIRQVAHETVSMVDSDKLDPALTSYNDQLREAGRLVSLYAHVLARDWEPLARVLSETERESACTILLERLASESWRAQRRELMETNDWANFDWDIFHYWVKLLALGADQVTINRAAADLATALAIPPSVSAGRWTHYFQWMRPAADPLRKAEISHAEFALQAAPGILMTRFKISPPHGRSPGAQYEIAEGYASSFMIKGQPGDRYRVVHQNSCFGAGTPVLMANGSVRSIEDVAPGDQVATPSGPAEVALVVRTPRAGRSLLRINGGAVTFTEGHPLLAAPGAESGGKVGHSMFMAASPALTGQTIPTLSWLGVDQLAPGARLLGWHDHAPTTVTVARLDVERANDRDERVYDVVVWPDPLSDCQYIVCNGSENIVVAAELPLLSKAPLAMQVVLAVIDGLAGRLERVDQPEALAHFLSVAVNVALPMALHRASRMTGSTAPAPVDVVLARTFERLRTNGEYKAVYGRVLAMFVQSLGPAIDNAIALGFRSFAPTESLERDAQVMVLSLHDITFRKRAQAELSKPVGIAVSQRGKAFYVSPAQIRPNTSDLPFLRRLNTLASLDLSDQQPLPTIETVHFDLIIDGRIAFFGQAKVDIAGTLPLRRYSARLMDTAHRPAGRLSFDLRYLSQSEWAAEEAARPDWSPAAMQAFAQHLSITMTDEVSSLFAAMHGEAGTHWEGIQ